MLGGYISDLEAGDDREHALAKIVVALVGSVGTHYVFERFLRVPLPDATLPALRSRGF